MPQLCGSTEFIVDVEVEIDEGYSGYTKNKVREISKNLDCHLI
ncbi:hypothetical protein [Candidatus Bandiella euplotis]|uniref:Uncharacterized protein n=1 Tax=Candidatus Bandiella euplotis TaxID=1664265 RepID=A0ABZ0UR40_9RICK|nr:hypothetical protein [Candidatus Bandiella woodruffii]WPX97469.1 hypothetical protein Bandiella_01629 [Candidatus Bandiella woodruffii]